MSKMILTRGIPASGKSTWAKQWVLVDPDNRARVNRDDLRFALFVKPAYNSEQEILITKIEKDAANKLLKAGKDVVIDATNLRPQYIREWRKLALDNQAEFEIVDFKIDLKEAIERDRLREDRSVGEDVIRNMWNKYTRNGGFLPVSEDEPEPSIDKYVNTGDRPICLIVDIDGTLALNKSGRSPYDYSQVDKDEVNEPIAKIVRNFSYYHFDDDYTIFIFSGRDDSCKPTTIDWLNKHSIPFDYLYMRKTGDTRKDAIIKKELFDKHIAEKYDVLFVLDDRDQVIKLWRDLGLTALQVDYGNF